MTTKADSDFQPGDVGFLTMARNLRKGPVRYTLSREPGRKNLSGEAVLNGWLGTTDGVYREALGLAVCLRADILEAVLDFPEEHAGRVTFCAVEATACRLFQLGNVV